MQPGITSLDLSVARIASASESDVDVTGVTEVNVNDSCYLLASDSVIFLFLKSVHKTSTIQLI